MTTLRGEIVLFGDEPYAHPVGAPVLIRQGNEGLAKVEVDRDNCFIVELGDDVQGEVEVVVALDGAAPVIVELDGSGGDVEVAVIYNPVGKTYI